MYVWIKALHIVAVISWMAGMLYLPRLFQLTFAGAVGALSQSSRSTLLFPVPADLSGIDLPVLSLYSIFTNDSNSMSLGIST